MSLYARVVWSLGTDLEFVVVVCNQSSIEKIKTTDRPRCIERLLKKVNKWNLKKHDETSYTTV